MTPLPPFGRRWDDTAECPAAGGARPRPRDLLTREMILDAQRRGLTPAQLAREAGCHRTSVYEALAREGVTLAPGRGGGPGVAYGELHDEVASLPAARELSDVGLVAFARALDAGQTLLGARVDALKAERARRPGGEGQP